MALLCDKYVSDRIIILHMPQQLSRGGMYKMVTWLGK